MTSQLGSWSKDKSKHMIEAIKLEPATSKYAIDLKILIDDKELLRLPEIKSGQQLRWNDVIECYVSPSSRIYIRIYEIHTFKRLRTGTIGYVISDVASRSDVQLESDSGKHIAIITFIQPGLEMGSVTRSLAQAEESNRHKRIVSDLGPTRNAIQAILAVGSLIAEFIPITEATFAICDTAWRKLEEQEQCDTNVERLMQGLVSIVPFVELVEKAVQLPPLQSTTENLISLINDASRFIVEYNADGSAVQTLRLFRRSNAREQVDGLLETMSQLKEKFDRGISIQMMLESQRAVLKELKPLGQALYDPSRGCLDGTRADIIREATNWAQVPDLSDRLLWLYGHAGLGKSAIATSLCQNFENLNLLAASFFCKRDDPERRNPQRVLTSIIHGLAVHHSLYAKAVVATIQEDSSICNAPMQTQYDKLFREPLQKSTLLNSSAICVVVVDALDECGTEETRRQLLQHICLMTQLARWLRVIVTSRPDMEIKDFFSQSDGASFSSRNVYHYDASNDIAAFVSKRLSSSARARGLPDDTALLLAARASGLFIWAQTACEFILNSLNPNARLDMVLSEGSFKNSTSALDNLYTIAIQAGLGDCGDDNAEIVQQCLGAIVTCSTRMPLSVDALSELLGHRISNHVMQSVVDSLGSVLYTDDQQGGAVRVYHPSFADYITTPTRSARFCVDTEHWNTELAESCIAIMTSELKFNICQLETSYKRNCDVQGLDKRVDEAISQRLRYSCIYWTSHLLDVKKNDLMSTGSELSSLVSGPRILFWIEVLSLIGKLDSALPSVRSLMSLSQGSHIYYHASDLERFLQTFYDPIYQSTPHLYLSALAFLPTQTTLERLRQEHFPNTIRIRVGAEHAWSAWLLCVSDNDRGVRAVAVSPDGHRIASVLVDDSLRVWDAETGVPLDETLVKHSHSGNSLVFSPGGRGIFTGLGTRGVRVWSWDQNDSNEDDASLGHSEPIACVSYSPDGSLVATGSYDKTLRLWRVDSLAAVGEPFLGHSADVRCIAFSQDGRRIISGSSDKTLRLWDTNTSAAIGSPFIGHSDVITCVTFSADGGRVASGSADKTICVWDTVTSALVVEPLVRHAGWIQSVAFHPGGKRLVSGSIDNTICVWDLDTGDMIGAPLVGHSGSVNSVVFTPDGQHIVSGSADRTVRVWDADIAPSIGRSLVGHLDRVIYVTFSSDGRNIISGSCDTTVHTWDKETGVPVGSTLVKDPSEAQCLALSPDGRYIVSGSPDSAVRLWETQNGRLVGPPLIEHSDRVTCVSFSSDSRRMASGSADHTLRVWDVANRVTIGDVFRGHSENVICNSFSPDNRFLASGSRDRTVRLWDTVTGDAVGAPFTGHRFWVASVAYVPDGSRIVSGSADQTVCIWDASTGVRLNILEGHYGPVRCIAVSRDGQLIGSASADSTVRVWDATSGDPIGDPFVGHSGFVTHLSFSPDSRLIVSGGVDKTVRVWGIDRTPKNSPSLTRSRSTSQAQLAASSDFGGMGAAGRSDDFVAWLPPQVNRLMKHCTSDGWVCSDSGHLWFWIPPAYRRLKRDDSLVVITAEPLICMVLLDYSRFTHGLHWSGVYTSQSS